LLCSFRVTQARSWCPMITSPMSSARTSSLNATCSMRRAHSRKDNKEGQTRPALSTSMNSEVPRFCDV
jgi:hypothetical protein